MRRSDDDRVLVLSDGALPSFELTDAPPWQVVTPAVDHVHDVLGLDIAVLRAARLDGPATGSEVAERLYEAEWLGGEPLVSGGRWTNVDDLDPDLRAALEAHVGDHQPWYRPGWHAELSAWVDERLADAGIRRRGAVRQVRSWGRSSLASVETEGGRLWAKAVPVVFAHEVRVQSLLTDIDPGVVPPLVAADPARGLMLMEHVAGAMLPDVTEPAAWTATMTRLAEVQRVLAEDRTVLSVAGVPDGALATLAARIGDLLADDDLLLVDRPGGLSAADAASVRRGAEAWSRVVARLAERGPAVSLDHGDLSAGQVIVGEMGPVILDWSDASVTHPFIAAASFLMTPQEAPSGLHEGLVAAYLEPWAAAGTDADRRTTLELARAVHPLHMAWLYADRILPGLDQRWEMERMVPWFLRSLLGHPAILPA